MNEEKILNLVGLAIKAGKATKSASLTINEIKRGEVLLVLMEEGLTTDSARQIKNKCSFYGIPLIDTLKNGSLKKATGGILNNVTGILDKGIKESILKLQ
ncbi:MAG: hypothetical protein H6687_01405 [Bacillales bacterium]|nr:hypothetical protein [Bacillales bacterium]